MVTAINIVSLLIISIFSPVENKNKPIAKANRKGLKIKSIVFSIIISIISIILHCKSIKYGSILPLILLLISMLIIVAKLKERRERIYEQTKNNKLIPAKIIKKVTGKIAALSCGAASIWGLKQPKEPRK